MAANNNSNSWLDDFKIISLITAVIIGAGALIYAGFNYLTANLPPKISNVKVFLNGDKIKVDYKREDEDGPFIKGKPINKDSLEWIIDNKVIKEYKNKTEIPVPDEKDKKILISCNVTGYDGFDKSKKVKSNSLEYFVQSPVVVDSNQVQIATAEDKINSNVPEEEKLYDGAGRDIFLFT